MWPRLRQLRDEFLPEIVALDKQLVTAALSSSAAADDESSAASAANTTAAAPAPPVGKGGGGGTSSTNDHPPPRGDANHPTSQRGERRGNQNAVSPSVHDEDPVTSAARSLTLVTLRRTHEAYLAENGDVSEQVASLLSKPWYTPAAAAAAPAVITVEGGAPRPPPLLTGNVDLGLLCDLKLLFSHPWKSVVANSAGAGPPTVTTGADDQGGARGVGAGSSAQAGIPRSIFLARAGPILWRPATRPPPAIAALDFTQSPPVSEAASAAQLMYWYHTIDFTDSGFVDWMKLSAFIASSDLPDAVPLMGGDLTCLGVKAADELTRVSAAERLVMFRRAATFATMPRQYVPEPPFQTGSRILKCIVDEPVPEHRLTNGGSNLLFLTGGGGSLDNTSTSSSSSTAAAAHAPSSRGTQAFCAVSDGTVRVFSLLTGNETNTLHYADEVITPIIDVHLDVERRHVILADAANFVWVYDADFASGRTGNVLRCCYLGTGHLGGASNAAVQSLSRASSGRSSSSRHGQSARSSSSPGQSSNSDTVPTDHNGGSATASAPGEGSAFFAGPTRQKTVAYDPHRMNVEPLAFATGNHVSAARIALLEFDVLRLGTVFRPKGASAAAAAATNLGNNQPTATTSSSRDGAQAGQGGGSAAAVVADAAASATSPAVSQNLASVDVSGTSITCLAVIPASSIAMVAAAFVPSADVQRGGGGGASAPSSGGGGNGGAGGSTSQREMNFPLFVGTSTGVVVLYRSLSHTTSLSETTVSRDALDRRKPPVPLQGSGRAAVASRSNATVVADGGAGGGKPAGLVVHPSVAWRAHAGPVTQIVWCILQRNPLGVVVSSSTDGTVLLYDTHKELKLVQLAVPPTYDGALPSVASFAVLGQRGLIVCRGWSRRVYVWSVDGGGYLHATFNDHEDSVVSVLGDDDRGTIASFGRDRVLRVYDAKSFNPVQLIRDREESRPFGNRPLCCLTYAHTRGEIVGCAGRLYLYPRVDGSGGGVPPGTIGSMRHAGDGDALDDGAAEPVSTATLDPEDEISIIAEQLNANAAASPVASGSGGHHGSRPGSSTRRDEAANLSRLSSARRAPSASSIHAASALRGQSHRAASAKSQETIRAAQEAGKASSSHAVAVKAFPFAGVECVLQCLHDESPHQDTSSGALPTGSSSASNAADLPLRQPRHLHPVIILALLPFSDPAAGSTAASDSSDRSSCGPVTTWFVVTSDGDTVILWENHPQPPLRGAAAGGNSVGSATCASITTAVASAFSLPRRAREACVVADVVSMFFVVGNTVEHWSLKPARCVRIFESQAPVLLRNPLHVPCDPPMRHSYCMATAGGQVLYWVCPPPANASTRGSVPSVQTVSLTSSTWVHLHSGEHKHTVGELVTIVKLPRTPMVLLANMAGDVFLVTFEDESLLGPQCCGCFRLQGTAAVVGLLKRLARGSGKQLQHGPTGDDSIAASDMVDSNEVRMSATREALRQHVAHVVETERRLGASKFTQFRHATQRRLHEAFQDCIVVSPRHILATRGDGDGYLLEVPSFASTATGQRSSASIITALSGSIAPLSSSNSEGRVRSSSSFKRAPTTSLAPRRDSGLATSGSDDHPPLASNVDGGGGEPQGSRKRQNTTSYEDMSGDAETSGDAGPARGGAPREWCRVSAYFPLSSCLGECTTSLAWNGADGAPILAAVDTLGILSLFHLDVWWRTPASPSATDDATDGTWAEQAPASLMSFEASWRPSGCSPSSPMGRSRTRGGANAAAAANGGVNFPADRHPSGMMSSATRPMIPASEAVVFEGRQYDILPPESLHLVMAISTAALGHAVSVRFLHNRVGGGNHANTFDNNTNNADNADAPGGFWQPPPAGSEGQQQQTLSCLIGAADGSLSLVNIVLGWIGNAAKAASTSHPSPLKPLYDTTDADTPKLFERRLWDVVTCECLWTSSTRLPASICLPGVLSAYVDAALQTEDDDARYDMILSTEANGKKNNQLASSDATSSPSVPVSSDKGGVVSSSSQQGIPLSVGPVSHPSAATPMSTSTTTMMARSSRSRGGGNGLPLHHHRATASDAPSLLLSSAVAGFTIRAVSGVDPARRRRGLLDTLHPFFLCGLDMFGRATLQEMLSVEATAMATQMLLHGDTRSRGGRQSPPGANPESPRSFLPEFHRFTSLVHRRDVMIPSRPHRPNPSSSSSPAKAAATTSDAAPLNPSLLVSMSLPNSPVAAARGAPQASPAAAVSSPRAAADASAGLALLTRGSAALMFSTSFQPPVLVQPSNAAASATTLMMSSMPPEADDVFRIGYAHDHLAGGGTGSKRSEKWLPMLLARIHGATHPPPLTADRTGFPVDEAAVAEERTPLSSAATVTILSRTPTAHRRTYRSEYQVSPTAAASTPPPMRPSSRRLFHRGHQSSALQSPLAAAASPGTAAAGSTSGSIPPYEDPLIRIARVMSQQGNNGDLGRRLDTSYRRLRLPTVDAVAPPPHASAAMIEPSPAPVRMNRVI